MDNTRLILVISLALLLMLAYQSWQSEQRVKQHSPAEPAPVSETKAVSPPTAELPPAIGSEPAALPLTPETASKKEQLLASEQRIRVESDTLRLEIDTLGGDVRAVELLRYPISLEQPAQGFRLLNDQLPELFIAQSGLFGQGESATHQARYSSEQTFYQLAAGSEQLEVPLFWKGADGTQVKKIYRLRRGEYALTIEYQITAGDQAWQGRLYAQLQRTAPQGGSGFIYTYTGGAIASPHSLYQKIGFDKMEKAGTDANVQKDGSLVTTLPEGWAGGWAAVLQHYFVAALIPPAEQVYHYYTKVLSPGKRYVLGLYSEPLQIPAGQQGNFQLQVYAGPKLQHRLAKLSPGLDLTVDYGYLWFLAKPLFWLLEWFYQLVGNWGWSIILLTVSIKLLFFHLSAASYKSMAEMRKLQPRLMALKERYANDQAALNQAMMDMYRKEKINPLGGCLPIVVQIPVFIALYWVLLESVELRQADFIFWIHDLSTKDPYFVLPLIMGATMFIQHFLNPTPMDELQQKMMLILPAVFTVFFAFFPAGLVLYWLVNNVLSITQQWYITKKIAGETIIIISK